jgi:drug/metabolite transporter (DMT)-like permease
MNLTSKTGMAKAALFGATLIWGSSFFLMKNTLDSIPIFYLLAIRFTGASVILALAFIKSLGHLNKEYLKMGSIMGGLLFCAYTLQTIGVAGTTPGKNAFLTAVYCIIVPFLYWGCAKKRPDIYNVTASVICVAGIGLVSLGQDFTICAGDAFTLAGGFFFAAHIIAVASFSRGRDIFLLTIIQFACAAVLGWIFGFLFNSFPAQISPGAIASLVYLCVCATAIALLLQNIGQKYTPPSTAAIILSLESVFGVLFSILFYHEVLTDRIAIGFALIFIAVLLSETKPKFFRRKKTDDIACIKGRHQ